MKERRFKQRTIGIDDERFQNIVEVANKMGVSKDALIRIAIDYFLNHVAQKIMPPPGNNS